MMFELESVCNKDESKLHDDAFYEVLKCTQVHLVTLFSNIFLPRYKSNKQTQTTVFCLGQEAIVLPPWVSLGIRLQPGVWEYLRVNVNALVVEELSVSEYLCFQEELVNGSSTDNFVLELDFEPFTMSFPKPTLTKSIGNGAEFLNKHLSTKMFHDKDSMNPLLDFLRTHHYKGKVFLTQTLIHHLL